MIDSRASSERPGGRRFWRYAGGLGVIGVIIALVLGAAFMRIGHDQRPRELPIAAVGTPATAQTVEAQAPGELSVRAVRDRAAARQEIAERDVHSAVVLGEQGVRELLIASAANSGVANFLRRTLGRATPDGVPRITDVRPLPEDDATGIDIALLLQVLLIGGSIAVVGIGRLLPRFEGDPRRGVLPVTFLAAYAVMLGFALTLISAAFGVGTDASFLDRVLAMALISAGVARVDRSARRPHRLRGSAVAGVLYFIPGRSDLRGRHCTRVSLPVLERPRPLPPGRSGNISAPRRLLLPRGVNQRSDHDSRRLRRRRPARPAGTQPDPRSATVTVKPTPGTLARLHCDPSGLPAVARLLDAVGGSSRSCRAPARGRQ